MALETGSCSYLVPDAELVLDARVSGVALTVAPLPLEEAESPQVFAERVPDERRPIHLQSADSPVRRLEHSASTT